MYSLFGLDPLGIKNELRLRIYRKSLSFALCSLMLDIRSNYASSAVHICGIIQHNRDRFSNVSKIHTLFQIMKCDCKVLKSVWMFGRKSVLVLVINLQ